jgi:glycoside/pentoside/hexuronide:cation symporter, GPH family
MAENTSPQSFSGGPASRGVRAEPAELDGAQRLPAFTRCAYGMASIAGNAISQTWGLWLVYFYAPPSDATIASRVSDMWGIDARVFLGITLTTARILESLDDPFIGYWSDRTKSRWGRRLPFIIGGTPVWALLFVLLFLPPVSGPSTGNLVYLFGIVLVFYLSSNLSGATIEALLPTLAKRADDRLSIATWQLVFGVAGAVVGLALSSLLVEFAGFTAMAVTVAAIALGVRYATAFAIWPYAKADATPSRPGFKRAVRETLTNRQFLAFMPSFVLFQAGLQMLTALMPFYAEAVLTDVEVFGFEGDENTGVFTFGLTSCVIVGLLLAIPIFRRLATRHGKAWAYRAAMVWAASWFPMLYFAGFIPGVPDLAQAVVAVFIAGMATAGVFLFPGIITADIVDYDATRTDTRREAMFYGTQNLLEKFATAFSPLVFALVLLAGDSEANPLGVRLVGPVAGVLVFAAFLSFRRYSLNPEASARAAAE